MARASTSAKGEHVDKASRRATQPVVQRIAVVFDLDDTLAPDTYRTLVESCGLSYPNFKRQYVTPLVRDGWDEILAKCFSLIQVSERGGGSITRDHLVQVGRDLRCFEGVPQMFNRVRKAASALVPGIEVEFYLLSAGLVELARALPFARQFKMVWGCQFHYGERGEIKFVKHLVNFPDKVRYLMALSKGISPEGKEGKPSDVYLPVPEEALHVPLQQVVYIGDGASDMPAFALLHENNGIAIGVYKSGTARSWPGHKQMREQLRLQNLAPADFRAGSELTRSIVLAVESMCKLIQLRQLGRGE
jgi:hypothetical protein